MTVYLLKRNCKKKQAYDKCRRERILGINLGCKINIFSYLVA